MPSSNDEFRVLFESAPDLLHTQDLQGRITRVNRAFERITGYARAEVLGMDFVQLVAPEHRDALQQVVLERMGGAATRTVELDIFTRSGERIPVELSADLIFDRGRPVGIQAFARDVTEKKREMAALSNARNQLFEKTQQLDTFARYLRLLHRLSTGSYEGLDEMFGAYLATGCEIFSVPHGAIMQLTPAGLTPRGLQGRAAFDSTAHQLVDERRTLFLTDGPHTFYIGAPLFLDGQIYGTVAFWSTVETSAHPHAREIIELMAQSLGSAVRQRQLTDQLGYLARHDPLTGLPNRLLMAEQLEEALRHADQTGSSVALCFIDLDRFKGINDSLGHAIGDRLLREIGNRLQSCIEPANALARMGGDEFTAILNGIKAQKDALEKANELLQAVHAPCRIDGYELFVTASIGISIYPRDGHDSGTLLRNADTAMYSAKYHGSNRVECYAAEVTTSAVERLSIETHLRRALERAELELLFQPQVDLESRLVGAEVLLMWKHPELGRVSPVSFIPVAEETGMILPIGLWVLREACQTAARWRRSQLSNVAIAVNVSAIQFAQANFVAEVSDILANTGLPASALELEVTESILMRDLGATAGTLSELRELGVRIAIDDFGTGYSSLNYLRRLPVDSLKIDRSFVRDVEDGDAPVALLKAIAALGHTFGLQVIAEGVETARQFLVIQKAGCDRAQGHLFGEAVDADSMRQLLLRRSGLLEPVTRA